MVHIHHCDPFLHDRNLLQAQVADHRWELLAQKRAALVTDAASRWRLKAYLRCRNAGDRVGSPRVGSPRVGKELVSW